MPDEEVKKKVSEASEEIEKVAKEVTEKVEEAADEIKKVAEKASEEIEKAEEKTTDLTVAEGALVVGKTVEEIDDLGVLEEDSLLVEIERGNKTITPKGDTLIEAGDIVTVLSHNEIPDKTRNAFTKKSNK